MTAAKKPAATQKNDAATPAPEVAPQASIPATWEAVQDAPNLAALAVLRQPFPERSIALLPQPVRRADRNEPRLRCEAGSPEFRQASVDGLECGGRHIPSIHLSYVGHAETTDRLLEADPFWEWEPLAFDGYGLPLFDEFGGLWIKLTVAGHTRLGYGDAQGKTGPNARKEVIGDAIRNAAMRFGVALDLWAKTDLHENTLKRDGADGAEAREAAALGAQPSQGANAPQRAEQPPTRPASFDEARAQWVERLENAADQAAAQAVWLDARTHVQRRLLDPASLDVLSKRYQDLWGAKNQEQAGEPTQADAARQAAAGEPEAPTDEVAA